MIKKNIIVISFIYFFILLSFQLCSEPLPLPEEKVIDMPPIEPSVVTAHGKRFLLEETDVQLIYDKETKKLFVSHPEWWIINYPLNKIKGLEDLSKEEISKILFGISYEEIYNWYIKTPGPEPQEPDLPAGPPPIRNSANPDLIVNNSAVNSSDNNPGTMEFPLKTISGALKMLEPGKVIQVYPGIYREKVNIKISGSKESPCIIEGIRDENGNMPVITGNDLFPPECWTEVEGLTGVYCAPLPGPYMGAVSENGNTLIERTVPHELNEGEYCFNYGSTEFQNISLAKYINNSLKLEYNGVNVEFREADSEGFIDLKYKYEESAGHSVFWGSTYIWVPPLNSPEYLIQELKNGNGVLRFPNKTYAYIPDIANKALGESFSIYFKVDLPNKPEIALINDYRVHNDNDRYGWSLDFSDGVENGNGEYLLKPRFVFKTSSGYFKIKFPEAEAINYKNIRSVGIVFKNATEQKNDGSVQIYINGLPYGKPQKHSECKISSGEGSLYIGYNKGVSHGQGLIVDNLYIWDQAITDKDILSIEQGRNLIFPLAVYNFEKIKGNIFYNKINPEIYQGIMGDFNSPPRTISGKLNVEGKFRAGRQTGSKNQVNPYRVWVNGKLLSSVVYSTSDKNEYFLPHPSRNYGEEDYWENFELQEGWNHLVFEWDTTVCPDELKFKFGTPKNFKVITSAIQPINDFSDKQLKDYISEYSIVGPFPAANHPEVYLRLNGNKSPNSASVDIASRPNEILNIEGDHIHVSGFEIRHGAQFQQRTQVGINGNDNLLEGCLIRDSEVGGIKVYTSSGDQISTNIIRGNWIINPGNTGIVVTGSSELLTNENLNFPAPGRGRVLIEHNTIINSNWAAYPVGWEAGGIKLCTVTGCILRYNNLFGGSGAGIWFDWETYNNRIEGNLLYNLFGYGIGIEASPGPNLVANNLIVDTRPGPAWFRYGLLTWSSTNVWFINNTIDGKWNSLPAWHNKTGTDGIFFGEGSGAKGNSWGDKLFPDKRKCYCLNNLITGCDVAILKKYIIKDEQFIREGNYTEQGKGALQNEIKFKNSYEYDYRLSDNSLLNSSGVESSFTEAVDYDFFGLLRLNSNSRTVGAFREELLPINNSLPLIEIELKNKKILFFNEEYNNN